ncbi:unnamed protein product [Adineta ricciae]|uniref:Protein HTATIP2 n=1 Tax=Adineta ricciae TaxID=249248 RepID=A0A816ERF7_ADIRI|nr:unnamed protein product [Adineta ricciae]
MSNDHVALVTGYTGESGKTLLKELIKHPKYKKIILVGRRRVDYSENEYKEKTEQRQVNFDKIDDYLDAFRGADIHFCCLGTTKGKAGAEGFRRVDFDYIVGAGRLAKQAGCRHFHLLSSQGADAHSLFLYTQVKGQTETALTQMSFDRLSIYRPAFLMVDREENRPFERFAQTVIRNTIQRVAPELITTPIEVLARAMCYNTFTANQSGVEILNNHAIFRLAGQHQSSE